MVVFLGDNKSAEILIKADADVNTLGGDYGSILQAVAFTRDNKSAEILIKAGANVSKCSGWRIWQCFTDGWQLVDKKLLLKF